MCEICKHNPCLSQCPNYIPKTSNYICCLCGEPIYIYDQYVRNNHGEYIHRDCISNIDWLIKWLGFEIKEMEEEDV